MKKVYINILILYLSHFWTGNRLFVSTADDGGVVESCSEEELAFGCKGDRKIIVLREAWLHDALLRVPAEKCHIPEYNAQFKKRSLLQSINSKCAFRRSCHFNANVDEPSWTDDHKNSWRGHVIRTTYECIDEELVIRNMCGKTLTEQEGWLTNIGYPKYYLGPGACTAQLVSSHPRQRIELTVVDQSIRDFLRPSESECRDYINVLEGENQRLISCGDIDEPFSVKSITNKINITMHTSSEIYPKRGFLIHFKIIGCPYPPHIDGVHLHHQTSSHAEYKCPSRHLFSDSFKQIRILKCKNQKSWAPELVRCEDIDVLYESGNITELEYMRYNQTEQAIPFTHDVIYDIIVPGIIMTLLILGNVGVIVMIFILRRNLQSKDFCEENEAIKVNLEPVEPVLEIPSRV